jgi:hypothetical protein
VSNAESPKKEEAEEDARNPNLPARKAEEREPQDSDDLPPALQTLIELEKQRIESANRRTDVVRFAIEANDASDKRQFEYRMAELDAGSSARQQRHSLAQKVVFSATAVAVVITTLLFGMAFFGTATQSGIALEILKISGVGVAGYGLIGVVVSAISKLFREK